MAKQRGAIVGIRNLVGHAIMAGITQMPLRLRRQLLFGLYLHRWGNFSVPRTFTEKVNWRMIYDRRRELAWTCDKLAIKDRATAAGLRTPETWWHGTDVGDLTDMSFRGPWVLKPNHRSGLVVFGEGAPDVDAMRQQTAGWLDNFQWVVLGEWAYSQARPLLVLEERLPLDVPVVDFKILTFDGEPRIIHVDTDRFKDHSRRFYTTDWVPLECEMGHPRTPPMPRPKELASMLDAARVMSEGLDFLRVDLYLSEGNVYLGEVTPYPAGGLEPIRPHLFDVEWGLLWHLPTGAAT